MSTDPRPTPGGTSGPARYPDLGPAPKWWAPYVPWLVRVAIAVATALAVHYGVPRPVIEVIKEIPVAQPDEPAGGPPPADARFAQGWVRDDDAVKAVTAEIPHPVFAATPAGAADAIPDRVYLWDYTKLALGHHIPARDQGSVGSCVAFGAVNAVCYSQCVGIVAAKKAGLPPPLFRAVAQEVVYGGSRVQIGGGRIRGDGSVGAWGAKWCQQYGSVPRAKYDGHDLTAYSEATCRRFGQTGCPVELIPVAKKAPTTSISQVKTVAEAKRALASGYPVTVASDVGFGQRGPYTRNAKGQLRASGEWMHQMCFIGYDKDSGFYCMNSWGPSWVTGPTGPGDPPAGGFYIEDATVARMLGQGDSWAFGDQTGFPSRALDWFVNRAQDRLRPRPIDVFALAW
jgi:hypothetical protein